VCQFCNYGNVVLVRESGFRLWVRSRIHKRANSSPGRTFREMRAECSVRGLWTGGGEHQTYIAGPEWARMGGPPQAVQTGPRISLRRVRFGRLSRGSPRPVGQRRRGPRTGPGPPRAVRVPPRTRSRLREVRGLRRVQEEGHPGPRDRGDDHGRARRPGPGTGGSSRLPYHAARTVSARPAKRTECKSCPARAGWRRPTIGRAATRQWDRAVQQTARSSGLKDENGYGDCPDMTTHRATAVRTCHCCARVIRVNCGGGASNPS